MQLTKSAHVYILTCLSFNPETCLDKEIGLPIVASKCLKILNISFQAKPLLDDM